MGGLLFFFEKMERERRNWEVRRTHLVASGTSVPTEQEKISFEQALKDSRPKRRYESYIIHIEKDFSQNY